MRHARAQQAAHQSEGQLFSVGDTPLSETGREQARRAGELIARAPIDVDSVHASPAKRSVETARIVADELDDHRTVAKHEDLLEVRFADSGEDYETALATIADTARRLQDTENPELPTGHTWQQETSRFADALDRILDDHETLLVVAHGAQNRAWLADALAMPAHRLFALEQDHACINRIHVDEGRRSLAKLNVTSDPLASEQGSREGSPG